MYCVDQLGNKSKIWMSDGLIVDEEKPIINFKFDKNVNEWNASNIKAEVTIDDQGAGIILIVCKYNGKEIKRLDYSNEKSLIYNKKLDLVLPDEAQDENGNDFEIYVLDCAGNTTNITKKIFIDKTAPVAKMSGVENNKHYNKDVGMTLDVFEQNYKGVKTQIDVQLELDGKTIPVALSKFGLRSKNEKKTYTFAKEGTYKVSVQFFDAANNKSQKITRKFIIDKTAPVVKISGCENKYYNKSVPLNINIKERYNQNQNIKISITRKDDGKVLKAPVGTLKNETNVSHLSQTITQDGEYEVSAFVIDQAGNASNKEKCRFVIDKIAPKINYLGVKQKQITNKPVHLKAALEEKHFFQKGAMVSVRRQNMEGKWTQILNTKVDFLNGKALWNEKFSEEGVYHILISAKDKSNNQEQKEIMFTIDKSAPVISGLKQFDGRCFKKFEWKDGNAVKLKDLTFVDSHVYVNGEEKIGTFTLNEDGKYILEVDAKDQSKIVSNEKVEFMVDSTAPEISATYKNAEPGIVAINDHIVVDDAGTLTLKLTDEKDRFESVKVNNKVIKMEQNANTINYDINRKGNYNIEAVAVDEVGNTTVLSSKVDYKEEKHFMIPVVVAVICVGILVCGAIFVYRKKER